MQNTSQTYKNIVADPNHEFRPRIVFATNPEFVITNENLIGISTTSQLISDFNFPIGNVCCSECDLEFIKPDITIPRMCKFSVYVQAYVDGTNQESEWLPKGTFFIDTRQSDKYGDYKSMKIHAYDAMRKAQADFPISVGHNWPAKAAAIVGDISATIGVPVDPRNTYTDDDYSLVAGYSCGEVLSFIAIINGGNWIITDQNTLRLVKLNDVPTDQQTDYITDEHYNPLTFGGTRITIGGDG